MSLDQFKTSPLGALIGPILNSEEMILRMETKSASDRPAVEVIGKDIEARVGPLDDEQKKLVDRWAEGGACAARLASRSEGAGGGELDPIRGTTRGWI